LLLLLLLRLMAPIIVSAAIVVVVFLTRPPIVRLAMPRGLGPSGTAFVSLHAPADGLGRYASANLDIWFLDDKTSLDFTATASTIGSCQHPLDVSFREAVDGNDGNATGVVAAVARTEANTPPRPEGHVRVTGISCRILRSRGILARDHLDESVALVLVDNACLHGTIFAEQ
jgi:hypothetical protein